MKDAWKKYHDLLERYTKVTEVRVNIHVYARAYNRGVEVCIGERSSTRSGFDWHSTGSRNVDTMRELGEAILAACDFVEESNPAWAKK